jgi:hypothetical protein
MNERIKELSKQAGCYYDGMGYGEGNIEKFAELIVRECAKVVFEKTGPKSALNVLEHFGVEE